MNKKPPKSRVDNRTQHPTKSGPGRRHGQGVPHPGKAMRATREVLAKAGRS